MHLFGCLESLFNLHFISYPFLNESTQQTWPLWFFFFFFFFFCHCRTLSALAHWAAIFGEVDYLALLSFPFVKLFQNNQLICFEMIATILSKLQKKKSTNFLDALFVFVLGWAEEGNTFTHRVRFTNMVLRSWTMLLLPLHKWLIASGTSKK